VSVDRAALGAHRLALALAAAGVAVSAALAALPALADRADRAPLVLGWSLACAALSAAVVAWPRREAPAVRDARRLRAQLAARLAAREEAGQTRDDSPLSGLLADALQRLDSEILPSLEGIAARHADLSAHLAAYQRGALSSPDPSYLERLRAIHGRQAEALTGAVRQAANADAASLAMVHEGDDEAVVARGRALVHDLDSFGATLRDVAARTDAEDWNDRLASRS
jgi:hypothetical protein